MSNETEIRASQVQQCGLCQQGIMHNQMPVFYVLRIQRFGVHLPGIQRTHGMEQFFGGNVQLARAMGADEVIAKSITPEGLIWICESCSTGRNGPVALIAEIALKDQEGG